MRLLLVLLLCLGLCGCADLNQYRKDANSKVASYFQQPNNNVMIVIDTLPDPFDTTMECHRSVMSLGQQGNSDTSFETSSPYVEVIPTGDYIAQIKKEYDSMSQQDKEKFLLVLPTITPSISISCQCKYARRGLDAAAYFDGKKIASDRAAVDYGMASLHFTIPIEDVLRKSK